jgi:methyl-accepting chemotaxis protein
MDIRPRNSISMRLAKMNMLVSTVALLLACVGFLAYDQITFRESLVHTLSAQAQIIGSNTVSAILFNDPQSATKTLSALRSSPSIDSAGILTSERRPFATYTKNAVEEIVALPLIPDNREEVALFRTNHVVLIRRIVSEGRSVGYVYIRAELGELVHRLKRYSLIAASVLVISLIAAMLVSSIFSRSVARPIIQLAETAQKVSRDRDYRLRAVPTGEQDEIATLIGSFNEMLDQIQQRDLALQRAHDELEQRVADRTRELLSANRELEAFSYSVSHDLRGPVDAMNGLSYLLLKKYGRQLDDNA